MKLFNTLYNTAAGLYERLLGAVSAFFVLCVADTPSPRVLLQKAWRRYTRRFLTLSGVLVAPMLLVVGLGELARFALVFMARTGTVGIGEALLVAGAGGLFVLSLLLVFFGQAALIRAICSSDDDIKVHEAYQRAEPHVFSIIWLMILLIVVIGGGFLLAIIPGILFFIWFSFAPFVLIKEEERGMRALVKSREYVRGVWLSISMHLVVIWGVVAAVAVAGGYVLQQFVLPLFNATMVYTIVYALIPAVLLPFVALYGFFLYEARARKVNLDNFSPREYEVFRFLALGALGYLVVGALFLVALFKFGLL